MGRISKAWRLLGVASVVVGLAAAAATTANASPIQHVVVLYQENHSFDNVLGRWCYNSGRCDGTLKGKLPDGRLITLRTATDLVPEMPHDIASQITAINGGNMDGFANLGATATSQGCGQDQNYACMSEFGASQIPNLTRLARRFVISDQHKVWADGDGCRGIADPRHELDRGIAAALRG